MYSVIELLNNANDLNGRTVSVYGYVVIRNGYVAIIQSDYNRVDWADTPFIQIGEADLQFAIVDQFPTRGGGASPIFDQAVVDAVVVDTDNEVTLSPIKILLRSHRTVPFKEIDFSTSSIEIGKKKWDERAQACKLWP